MFGEATGAGHLDAIFVTNTRRTQQTAAPLAARLHLVPVVLPAADVAGTATRLLREHRGGTVIVVGHGNTIPELIRELSGKQIDLIKDDDYGEIYVLSVPRFGGASLVRMRY
jgi:broad specificity phosphatase PhoE